MNYTDYKLTFQDKRRDESHELTTTKVSIPPQVETEIDCHYIFVNSGYRNTDNYPLHYDYRINLNDGYNDVISIEMVSVTFPNSTNILNEPVLMFDIEEINFIKAQNTAGTNIFSIVPLKGPNKVSGGFINPELACNHRALWCNETNPISRLSSLTVKIRDVDGALYDFGVSVGDTTKALQHSFVLKLKTKIPIRNKTYLRYH
jgi:hypothetical protein